MNKKWKRFLFLNVSKAWYSVIFGELSVFIILHLFFFVILKLLLSDKKRLEEGGYMYRVGLPFKKEILRRTLCTNRGWNDAHLHVGWQPLSLQSLCRNCCLVEPSNPGVTRGIMLCRAAAVPCPPRLLQHVQLTQQCLLLHLCSSSLHPRANHPFLVGSNLRSSTLGVSTTHRNSPHFYVKRVQSRFKYSLNEAFFL